MPPRPPILAAVAAFLAPVSVKPASAQWTEFARLTPSDGQHEDYFGHEVCLSGRLAVIGAWGDDDLGDRSGSAYVFDGAGRIWTRVAKLTASDGAEGDGFGFAVSASGDALVIGAYGDDDRGNSSGSAYVFERINAAWTQTAKLTAADGAANDHFGWSVAMDGDRILIGAYGGPGGSAYLFERRAGDWSQAAKLTPPDGEGPGFFAYDVALSGDLAVIGAYGDDDHGESSGSAFLFERSGGVWQQAAKLVPADGYRYDQFGRKVAASGRVVLIGASLDDDRGDATGSAYVFEESGGTWEQTAKITASDARPLHQFGSQVAVGDGLVIIGAIGDDGFGTDSGSVYVFERMDGAWKLTAKLHASQGGSFGWFGVGLAVNARTLLVGQPGSNGYSPGRAYVFAPDCPPDIDGDGTVDTHDLIAYLALWLADDPEADFDHDGVVNSLDFIAYLNAWASGC